MAEYDLLVIGAGSGGTRAARWAATNYKAKVASVELPFGFISSKDFGGAGGTCVLRGCVPKKLMWISSSFHSALEDAVGFGWPDLTKEMLGKYSFQKFMEAKNKEIERLHKIYIKLLDGAKVDRYEGRASLLDSHTAEVLNVSTGEKT